MRCQIGTGESLKQKIVIVHLRWVLVLWSSDVTQYDENMTNKQSQCGGGGPDITREWWLPVPDLIFNRTISRSNPKNALQAEKKSIEIVIENKYLLRKDSKIIDELSLT